MLNNYLGDLLDVGALVELAVIDDLLQNGRLHIRQRNLLPQTYEMTIFKSRL